MSNQFVGLSRTHADKGASDDAEHSKIAFRVQQKLCNSVKGGGGQKHFAALRVPRQCPLVLLVRKVTLWEVKRVKRYDVDFVVSRGEKFSRDFAVCDPMETGVNYR
jgi:hypothetical protein